MQLTSRIRSRVLEAFVAADGSNYLAVLTSRTAQSCLNRRSGVEQKTLRPRAAAEVGRKGVAALGERGVSAASVGSFRERREVFGDPKGCIVL